MPFTARRRPRPSSTTATTASTWAGRMWKRPSISASRRTAQRTPSSICPWERHTCSPGERRLRRCRNTTSAGMSDTESCRRLRKRLRSFRGRRAYGPRWNDSTVGPAGQGPRGFSPRAPGGLRDSGAAGAGPSAGSRTRMQRTKFPRERPDQIANQGKSVII